MTTKNCYNPPTKAELQKNLQSKLLSGEIFFGDLSVDASSRVITIDSIQYHFVKKLGNGSSGHVICLEECNSKRLVALKSIHKLEEAKREHFALKELNEVNKVAKLKKSNILRSASHVEHIVDVLGVRGPYYLLLEKYKCDLIEYINSQPKMQELESILLFYKVLMIVRDVHSKGLFNSDIKAENIFLSEEEGRGRETNAVFNAEEEEEEVGRGRDDGSSLATLLSSVPDLVLGDFGGYNPTGGNIFGTLSIVAPEQAGPCICDRQVAEMWQLGVLLFSLLYFDRPFGTCALYQDYDGFNINHRHTHKILNAICNYDFANSSQAKYASSLKQCFNSNFKYKVESDAIWNLISRMFMPNPANRASLEEIISLTESLLADMTTTNMQVEGGH